MTFISIANCVPNGKIEKKKIHISTASVDITFFLYAHPCV